MIKVIKKLFKSMEKQCNIPVDSSCNCINCNNCRQNQYSKYRYDRYICDINKNYVTDPYHHGCTIFEVRDYAANGVVAD